MSTMMNRQLTRRAAALLATGAVLFGAACSDFLVAENPAAIEEPDVNSEQYVNLIANGPQYAFQLAWDDVTYWNAQLADEIYNREVFVEEGQIDRRELYSEMTYITAFMYNPLQHARFVGEDAARRLKIILADSASRDIRVARSLAYAGYGYVGLGEMNCTTPIDLGVPKTPAEIFQDAIDRFDEAIQIATDARTYLSGIAGIDPNLLAATDSVRWFALVGAARASLNRNELAQASAYAAQVPAAFVYNAYYTTQVPNRVYNRLEQGSSGNLQNSPFMAMDTDPRVPRLINTGATNGKPLSPTAYSTYNGVAGNGGGRFAVTMAVRIASGLEAQYIVAEAAGPTAATSAFVDARRAVGGQAALNLAAGDPQIMAELRDQRRRDFYLDNHRLGDLRRYAEFYGVNEFPTGPYPTSTSGQVYSTSTCWPLPVSEINDNPNIP
jgi:hypothetical protein